MRLWSEGRSGPISTAGGQLLRQTPDPILGGPRDDDVEPYQVEHRQFPEPSGGWFHDEQFSCSREFLDAKERGGIKSGDQEARAIGARQVGSGDKRTSESDRSALPELKGPKWGSLIS